MAENTVFISPTSPSNVIPEIQLGSLFIPEICSIPFLDVSKILLQKLCAAISFSLAFSCWCFVLNSAFCFIQQEREAKLTLWIFFSNSMRVFGNSFLYVYPIGVVNSSVNLPLMNKLGWHTLFIYLMCEMVDSFLVLTISLNLLQSGNLINIVSAAIGLPALPTPALYHSNVVSDSVQTLLAVNQRLRQRHSCIRCRIRPRQIVYIPCGHHLFCTICHNLQSPRNCPVCHSFIRSVINVHYS